MKNNRGFTLIEIIVSLALLSIISVGMISGLTSQFRFLTSTRNFTEDLSLAQQTMEGEIVAVKKTLEASGTPSGETSYTLFTGAYERTVAGYPREFEVSLGNTTRTFYAVVGSEVLDFPVATATVSIEFQPINTTLFEYSSSLYASSDVSLVDPTGVNLTNIYRWYVSRPGFNIPMISTTPEEVENGTTYPRFPDDYSIIPSASNTTLASVISRYPGRHVMCTVTPASTSGKMGATAVSNPVFVSGLPVRSDLQLHLDASLISREAPFNLVRASGSNYYVKNWADSSGEGNDAAQSTDNRQPQLVETYIGDIVDNGFWYETYAKYAAFDGSNDYVNTTVSGVIDTTGATSTVFVVARDAGAENFTIYTNTVPAGYVSFSPSWSTTSVTVGNAGSPVDVAEVIIYNAVLSAGDNEAVMDYLEAKYLPVTPAVFIRWLTDVTATVVQNAPYTPPSTVSAYMTNGRYMDVPVTWSPNTIDTSTLGDKVSTCTAVADTTKHSTLTVHVMPPTPLIAIGDITVSENGTYAALTAGALTPAGATASYQWQVYTAGAWQNIVGAVSSVYSNGVWGQQYRVVATGTGVYIGTVTSNPITLNVTPLVSIAAPLVTGGGSYAQLTAGDLNPSAATAAYQWQIFSSGSWNDVSGATSNTYNYAAWNSSYRVKATGIGAYSGTVYSVSCTPTQVALTGIDDIAIYWDGAHFKLTAGAVAPSGATVTYQWQYYRTSYPSGWINVSGATSSTYTATANTRYRVQATGTGMYYGTVTSNEITAEPISLHSIGATTVTWDGANPILTAGAIDPAGATVTYQWQYYSSYYGRWYDVNGATSSTYTGTSGTRYRIEVTGTGMYTGTIYGGELTVPTRTPVTAVHITYSWVGSDPVLRVDSITPSAATVTYQWWSNPGTGWSSIEGATSSSYTGIPGTQYKVVATGTDMYYGTVESSTVAVPNRISITEVVITYTWSGANAALSVSSISPTGATATYQWWSNSGGGWSSIAGATSSTYTGAAGAQYRVVATGTGAYTGMVESNTLVVPTRTLVTDVGNITVTWSGSSPVMTAGAIEPPGATVTYQWYYYRTSYPSGWVSLSGATSSTYTGSEGTRYYVTATGTGAYYGTAQSEEFTPRRSALTGIGDITFSWNGSRFVLTAGAVVPTGATVTYQWQSYGTSWSNITGATSSTYSNALAGTEYRVMVTGTGAYSGTIYSDSVTPGTEISVGDITITLSGTTPVLTAGAVTPTGATFTYQWQFYNYGWTNITGATSSSYSGSFGTRYRVSVTGTGAYYGTAYSAEITPTKTSLTGIDPPTVSWNGSRFVLTAGDVYPSGATVTYQWQYYDYGWSNISGATSSTYNTTSTNVEYRVTVTGTGAYTGTRSSTSVITGIQVTSVANITLSGSTLYPGTVSPTGATVTYQWQRRARTMKSNGTWRAWGSWSNIGTSSTCTFTADTSNTDYQYQLIVTGYGQYYDDATSPPFG